VKTSVHPPKAEQRTPPPGSQELAGLLWRKRQRPSEWYHSLPLVEMTLRFKDGAWNGRIGGSKVLVRKKRIEDAAQELVRKFGQRLLETLRSTPSLGQLLTTTLK
jgi:hypothetical protein